MENIKFYSEIERYEIININDGDKYGFLGDNDILIDEEGNLLYLIVNLNKNKFSFFNNNNSFLEMNWDCVKKIGSRTIIVDFDENYAKKNNL